MKTKIRTLETLLSENFNCPVDVAYDEAMKQINAMVFNYADYSSTKPVAVDVELKKLPEADYNMCCALMTMVLREDHFINGRFGKRYRQGEVQPVVERMIYLLKEEYDRLPWTYAGTVKELFENRCMDIPKEYGVYRIFCFGFANIGVLNVSTNHRAKLYDVQKLRDKYESCKDKKTLYIGKSSAKKGLFLRLKQFVDYGYDKSCSHAGGRAIWQIEGTYDFKVEYAVCDKPEKVEHELLDKYKSENGVYPLANWKR